MKILGKRSDLPFSRKSDRQKEKRKVSFTHMQNIICSQSDLQPNTSKTQLYGIAHKQTIICRQLFAGHVVGSRPMKRKKNLLRIPTGKYDVHVRTLAMNLLGLSLKLIPICLLPFFFFFFFSIFLWRRFCNFEYFLAGTLRRREPYMSDIWCWRTSSGDRKHLINMETVNCFLRIKVIFNACADECTWNMCLKKIACHRTG